MRRGPRTVRPTHGFTLIQCLCVIFGKVRREPDRACMIHYITTLGSNDLQGGLLSFLGLRPDRLLNGS